MFNLKELFDRYAAKGDCYQLAATLHGHTGAVNGFSFNQAGTFLASSSDDQEVRIWDVRTFREVQMLRDAGGRWGQITCIKLAGVDGVDWLCFGTGRGLVLVFCCGRKADLVEVSSTWVFPPSDSTESITFKLLHQRLAVSSHFGQVKVYNWNNGNFMDLWSEEMTDVIPRAVLFREKGKSLIMYGMENGTMLCRDAETAATIYTRVLKSSIGNVSTCPAEKYILIDNMIDGFDLYSSNRTSPVRTFQVPSTRKFVKKGVFAEKGGIVACGSDHGKVYVFGINNSELIQILKHGKKDYLVQTIESLVAGHHMQQSPPSGKWFIQWTNAGGVDPDQWPGCSHVRLVYDGPVFVLMMEWVVSASTTTFEQIPGNANFLPDIRAKRQVEPVDYKSFLDMDDETLRKVLGVRKLLASKVKDALKDTDQSTSLA